MGFVDYELLWGYLSLKSACKRLWYGYACRDRETHQLKLPLSLQLAL